MAIQVATPWGYETYPTATDWDTDRGDHSLMVIAESGGETEAVAAYASGQWLRVARVVPASTPPA